MLKPLKVATPLTAATAAPPLSVPAGFPGLFPIARLTLLVAPVIRAPNWSRISTVTAGVIVAPAVVLVGCCTKPTEVATGAGAVMLKALEFTEVKPAAAKIRDRK